MLNLINDAVLTVRIIQHPMRDRYEC